MGSSTEVEQVLETNIDVTIKPELDVALKSSCVSSSDASQTLSNITIDNAKGVTLAQVNQAKNLCSLKTTMDFLDKLNLSNEVMQKAMDKILTQGGIGPTTSASNTKIITNMKTNISPKVAFDIQKQCLQSSLSAQKMDAITIKNSADIVLSQTNESFNSCLQEEAIKKEDEYKVDLGAKSSAAQDVTTKGWDPIGSLLALLGGPLILGVLGICICLCCVCVLVIVFGIFMSGALGGSDSANAVGAQVADRTVFTD
jgi:hypothetical protein